MKDIKTLIIRKLLSKLIRMRCPSNIPRSGEEGEAQNCFIVRINKGQEPFFLLDGLDEYCLKGRILSGDTFKIDASIPFALLNNKEIEIKHYYGLSTIKYSGIYDYIINGLTRKDYLKIHIISLFSKIWRYYFNKQKLVMKQRHELLKVLIDHYINNDGRAISSIFLMTKLYSINWIDHPEGNKQEQKLNLYLESFVSSGDLQRTGTGYSVTSQAIMTLSKYEEEGRRHMDIVKLQKKMVILNRFLVLLTICIVIFAMIQAGVIKLPVLLDLSKTGK